MAETECSTATKICIRCDEERPVENFGKDRRQEDGVARLCKACIRKEGRLTQKCPACQKIFQMWRAAWNKRHSDLCPGCHNIKQKQQRSLAKLSSNCIKICTKCKESKPATPEKRWGSRLIAQCKDCVFYYNHRLYTLDEQNWYRAVCLLVACLISNVEYQEAYRKTQREEKLAALRKWRMTHQEERRLYKASRSEKNKEECRTRRARRNGAAIHDFTNAQWRVMQEHYDHRCVYCGKRFKGKLTQDHLTPLSQGGNHTASNIVPACRSCNSRKHAGPAPVPVQPLLLIAV